MTKSPDRQAMVIDLEPLRELMQSLSIGLAIASADDWKPIFENDRFSQWFPPGGKHESLLPERLPGLNTDRAFTRLQAGRPFSFETEADLGGRTVPISVELRQLPTAPWVAVECRDISRQKRAEYMLESYSNIAEKNTRDLQREKDRVEKLLLNIMPKSVYEEMKDYGTVTPQRFDNASVLMLDFVDFTDMAIAQEPGALITELNDIFTAFDRIVELFGCDRIKTIGDAYLAVSGLPDPTPDHAHNIARVALRMRRYIERRNKAHTEGWRCRIGIHAGPVIGSIVGIQKYIYDIFGPGINLAARLERQSEPMGITISEEFYRLIQDDFLCSDRGEIEVKGFGKKRVYTLERERDTRG